MSSRLDEPNLVGTVPLADPPNARSAIGSDEPGRSSANLALKLAALALWLVAVVVGMARHVMWRDEVRALTVSLQGDTVFGMARAIYGEGHPILWYLLLRGGYVLFGGSQALPVVAFLVALAAALLLVFRAPFAWPLVALILLGHFFVHEYAVVARNYGIAMLVLFAVAACYKAYRDRGFVLGLLLFLLANCSIHSAVLAIAFLGFWLLDILQDTGLQWTSALTNFVLNAGIAAIGLAVCLLTIYPSYNDADASPWRPEMAAVLAMRAILAPGAAFWPFQLFHPASPYVHHLPVQYVALLSIILFGSVLGLLRRPGAVIAALFALIVLSVFFNFVVAGGYRHQAQWFVFLIALYWVVIERAGSPWVSAPLTPRGGRVRETATKVGFAVFVALLGVQAAGGAHDVALLIRPGLPESRFAEFAAWVHSRSDLRDAAFVSDYDPFLEALPYYLTNPTIYMAWEGRYRDYGKFSASGRHSFSLDDVLAAAREVNRTTGKPVVIIAIYPLDPNSAAQTSLIGKQRTYSTTPEQIDRFLASTKLLAKFPPTESEQSYAVYLLN